MNDWIMCSEMCSVHNIKCESRWWTKTLIHKEHVHFDPLCKWGVGVKSDSV